MMKKMWFVAPMFVLSLFLAIRGHSLQTPKTGRNLTVLYSNNINGEVDPCPT